MNSVPWHRHALNGHYDKPRHIGTTEGYRTLVLVSGPNALAWLVAAYSDTPLTRWQRLPVAK